jgi:hypothetical protein
MSAFSARLCSLGVALGALAVSGCETIDVGPATAQLSNCEPPPGFFVSDVWPKFFDHYGCGKSGCHDASTGRSAFRLQSLTGVIAPLPTDPPSSWPAAWAANLLSVENNLDCAAPSASAVLVVPENQSGGHGGGTVVTGADVAADVALFRMWLQ